MIENLPASFMIMLFVSFFAQIKYAKSLNEQGLLREYRFTRVSGFVCLGLAVAMLLIRLFF